MPIPTEPIGSIPRPTELRNILNNFSDKSLSKEQIDHLIDKAVRETIRLFEATGSPVITDGEQAKPSFATYPLVNLENLAPDGIEIPFEDGHIRQLPRLTQGPFQYGQYAGSYLKRAEKYATRPLKQSVIASSALSLLYPEEGLTSYSREKFLDDLVDHAVEDIRSCLNRNAYNVQVDFTEGRLAVRLDPSKKLLQQFIDLNNRVFSHFTPEERRKIGVHTCPGGDHDSTHSADVPYEDLIPDLMKMDVGHFYMQMASEENPDDVLKLVSRYLRPHQRVFIGVIDVNDEEVEKPEKVCERLLKAAEYIPAEQLGSTDDCGFSPFSDDAGTNRDIAFAKIKARVEGTRMASRELGI